MGNKVVLSWNCRKLNYRIVHLFNSDTYVLEIECKDALGQSAWFLHDISTQDLIECLGKAARENTLMLHGTVNVNAWKGVAT